MTGFSSSHLLDDENDRADLSTALDANLDCSISSSQQKKNVLSKHVYRDALNGCSPHAIGGLESHASSQLSI